ncbi:fibronectin type III domain-containing protein [Leptospira sp. 201903070]|uniref:Fibronectin type III domain-containing protein n=1 Tax=Leptospira ainlahdjerensis TaxID=2810033 RepID=A0ABS2UIC1_9LEPT|nr:fibronectin type III domain-containing protein [Leptospira ainlahdjerensis]MBM9579649.1 fibronectin type III domain-containing protein [Leptospira ainlahdjerensis]
MKSLSVNLLILFCGFISNSVYSEDRNYTYYIEWNEVKGNNGYKIEIRKKGLEDTIVKEEKVSTNSLEFKILAGEYEFRISALNRFGKPSSWSQWSAFLVEQDRPKSMVEAEKKQTFSGSSSWRIWVPGLVPLEKKEYGKASLILFWFGALAVAGNAERNAGNSLSQSSTNDPTFITLVALYSSVPVSYYFIHQREEDKKEYNRHQSNQVGIGVLALLSYGLNVWLEKRSFHSTTVLIESKSENNSRWIYPNSHTNSILSLGRVEISFRKEFE